MKKSILFLFVISLVVACGTTKNSKTTSNKPDGTWILSSINYDNSDRLSIKLFNDANNTCFIGSTWKFSSNGTKGTYLINNPECNPGKRYFDFTVDPTKQDKGLYDFLIKPTDANGNSVANAAFRTKMIYISPSKMQWQQTTSLDGRPFVFKIDFTK